MIPPLRDQIMLDLHHRHTRYSLPSVMMRAGTSKGLFIHRGDMPPDAAKWPPVLLAAMGSRDGDQRQLDGVGGATSTTSKVAIVSKSSRPDADVDYTFAQVAVGSGKVDFTGNCGNMASGVGPFALDEGLVKAQPGQTELDVRIFNTNTQSLLIDTIKVDAFGNHDESGSHHISGVLGTGSEIKVSFLHPAGSMTGHLFPTGNRQDTITVSAPTAASTLHQTDLPLPFTVKATLIDAANPFIHVDAASLPPLYHRLGPAAPQSLALIELIRRAAAVRYGLAKDVAAAALVRGTPKIAVLSPPHSPRDVTAAGEGRGMEREDICVTAFSMGKVHPSLQLTGAVCLAAAVCVEGTVAHELSHLISAPSRGYPSPPRTPQSVQEGESEREHEAEDRSAKTQKRQVKIRHANGIVAVDVEISQDNDRSGSGDGVVIEKGTVSRTARRLFEGNVLVSL